MTVFWVFDLHFQHLGAFIVHNNTHTHTHTHTLTHTHTHTHTPSHTHTLTHTHTHTRTHTLTHTHTYIYSISLLSWVNYKSNSRGFFDSIYPIYFAAVTQLLHRILQIQWLHWLLHGERYKKWSALQHVFTWNKDISISICLEAWGKDVPVSHLSPILFFHSWYSSTHFFCTQFCFIPTKQCCGKINFWFLCVTIQSYRVLMIP